MQIDKDELLNQAKDLLKEEVTQIAFQTWFSSLEIAEMNDSHIVLKTASPYAGELLQTRYADLVLNTFKFITNREWTFSVIYEENNQTVDEGSIISSTPTDAQDQEIEILQLKEERAKKEGAYNDISSKLDESLSFIQ